MSKEIQKLTTEELMPETIDALLSQKASFQVAVVKKWGKTVDFIQERIEKAGLRCRLYTECRSFTATAGAPPIILGGPVTSAAAAAAAAAIGGSPSRYLQSRL